MAGVPNAKLEAWVVPAQGAPWWDHTYVTSSCGFSWGCFGRAATGTPLAAGIGDSAIADCLSKPVSAPGVRPWVCAGLTYLIDGVCHQAANRILYPAGITVAGCAGYSWSVLTYGAYSAPWPERSKCVPPGTVLAGATSATPVQQGDAMDPKSAYDRTVTRLPISQVDAESARLIELDALVKFKLGKHLDKQTFEFLADVQAELQDTQRAIGGDLRAGKITLEVYLDRLTIALHRAKERGIEVLGPKRFEQIFGAEAYNPEAMIDREMFLHAE